jgi:hypothetical protein
VSLKAGPAGVAICAKLLQPAPSHRSTTYPVTATLSVEAAQLKLICVLLATTGTGVPGAVGACVSGAAGVVALATPEYALRFGTASVARTR